MTKVQEEVRERLRHTETHILLQALEITRVARKDFARRMVEEELAQRGVVPGGDD